jgi:hypothetical protein
MWRAWADIRRKHPSAGYGGKNPASPASICADIKRVRTSHALDAHLTATEAAQLDRPLGKLKQYEVHNGTWTAEAIRTLAWALHGAASLQDWPTHDRLSYSATFYPSTLANKPLPPWLRKPRLRPPSNIERMRRIAALWTWRYRAHLMIESPHLTLAGRAALIGHLADRISRESKALRIDTENGDIVIGDINFWRADGINPFAWEAFAYGHSMRHHALEWVTGRAPDWESMVLPTPEILDALRPAHAPRRWSYLTEWCKGRMQTTGPKGVGPPL